MYRFIVFLMVACFASASADTETASEIDLLAAGLEEKVAAIASQALGATASGASLPGISLAEGISEVTGVAISPLLGISSVGAWKYWHTETTARARLPWYCQPWAWGSGLGLILLCFCKDLSELLCPEF